MLNLAHILKMFIYNPQWPFNSVILFLNAQIHNHHEDPQQEFLNMVNIQPLTLLMHFLNWILKDALFLSKACTSLKYD